MGHFLHVLIFGENQLNLIKISFAKNIQETGKAVTSATGCKVKPNPFLRSIEINNLSAS